MLKTNCWKFIALVLWIISCQICFSQTIIFDCKSLQDMNTNMSENYQINQTIDCTGFNFCPIGNSSSPFTGVLDGKGSSINNLTISSSTINHIALFAFGNGSTVMNLVFFNVNVTATNSSCFVATLFGECFDCNLQNVELKTTSSSLRNLILGHTDVAGLCGKFCLSSITNCSVENTIVSGGSLACFTGGLIAHAISSTIQLCYNYGILSNTTETIVFGKIDFGGVIGRVSFSSISQCGTHQGTIFGTIGGGGVFGYAYNCAISQIYSLSNVFVNCSTLGSCKCGGLIGSVYFAAGSFSGNLIKDVYSKANVTGFNKTGGLFGRIILCSKASLNISNSFSSSFLSPIISSNLTTFGNIIEEICNTSSQYNLAFSQVYFNNHLNLFPAFGFSSTANSTDKSSPQGFSCSQLWGQINSTFDQTNIWGGDRLRNEIGFNYGSCNCVSGCSTQAPTTQISSTQTPTTQILPTPLPPSCYYQVPNCQNCSTNPPLVDLTQLNVSCSFIENQYLWIFQNKTSNTITNSVTIILNGSTTFIQGNFIQTSNGNLVFVISSNNNKSSSLNVGGCVSINGNISLSLETQPQQGTTNFQIISYNCSQQVNISSSQIQVIPNYNGSSCDTINSQAIDQPNSLGLSITSTLGNKCNGGNNLGLIIGLAVGIPSGLIVIFAVSLAILKSKQNREVNAAKNRLKQEAKMKNAKVNPNFKQGNKTEWHENVANEMESI